MEEQRQQRQKALSLPSEVWQLIALHMEDIESWARVSGTCKATWDLQLDEVALSEFILPNPAAAAWVLKRACQARRLKLGPLQGSNENEDAEERARTLDVIPLLLQAGNDWGSLRALRVISFGGKDITRADKDVFLVGLTWLLTAARGITFLNCSLPSFACMPPMSQLRHLQIELNDSFCHVAASLASLKKLQSLCLIRCDLPDAHLELDARPVLELSGLSCLKTVMLDGVTPSAIALSEGTALHIKVYSVAAARQEVWRGVASALHSFYLRSDTVAYVDVVECLAAAKNLKTISLEADSLIGRGLGPVVLDGPFLQVERLRLSSSLDMRVRIPAGKLPWHMLHINCFSTLILSFQSMADFAECCKVFTFEWCSLHGTALMKLLQLLGGRGLQYADNSQEGLSQMYLGSCVPLKPGDLCICGACSTCSEKGSCGPDAQFKW